jgi:hypothetical protein
MDEQAIEDLLEDLKSIESRQTAMRVQLDLLEGHLTQLKEKLSQFVEKEPPEEEPEID